MTEFTPFFKRRSFRTLVSLGLCTASLLLAAVLYRFLESLRPPLAVREQVTKTYNVEVFDVERTDLLEIVSGFGTARADREAVLSAQVSGEIIDIHPELKVGREVQPPVVSVSDAGESVRSSGHLLLQVDPRTYQERVIEARNLLKEDATEIARLGQEKVNNQRMLGKAREDYKEIEKDFERIKNLRKSNAVTPSQLTKALLELRKYEEAILQRENDAALIPLRLQGAQQRQTTHRTQLQLAELDLERTDVRPPFAGRLSEVMVDKGQFVRVGDPLVRLTDILVVEIPVPLALNDYGKLEPRVRAGEQPPVELAENETDPPRWFGRVVRVAPEADESTRTVNVFVQVENSGVDVPLLPGTFVHARIEGPVLKDVVAVPRDAVVNGSLFVVTDDRAAARSAEVSRTLQSLALVEAGLEPGDSVILTNLDIIHEQAQVAVQKHRSLSDELNRQRVRLAGGTEPLEPGTRTTPAIRK